MGLTSEEDPEVAGEGSDIRTFGTVDEDVDRGRGKVREGDAINSDLARRSLDGFAAAGAGVEAFTADGNCGVGGWALPLGSLEAC